MVIREPLLQSDKLMWVSGHEGSHGNQVADILAKVCQQLNI